MSDDDNHTLTLNMAFRRNDNSKEDLSPVVVALAVLFVFVLSPVILCGNALLLTALYRFKRLRTPSNYLVISLAAADLGAGLFLPLGLYLELTAGHGIPTSTPGSSTSPESLCLLPYCFGVFVCSASIIMMAAIALDRFTSLAQPLRYNNLITPHSMERYVLVFWGYAGLAGLSPLLYSQCCAPSRYFLEPAPPCAFHTAVPRPLQLALFCTVYGPSAAALVGCYCYVYVVARYHARAIYTVELSLRQQDYSHTRYGQTLAITVGLFIGLWLPFQAVMLTDMINDSSLLSGWTTVFLALPVFLSSALNPWVYGYRNSEVRHAVRRVLEELVGRGSPPCPCPVVAEHAELNSFASHVRLCAVSPQAPRCSSLLTHPPTELTQLTAQPPETDDVEAEPLELTAMLAPAEDNT